MLKVMRVVKNVHSVEKERKHSSLKKKTDKIGPRMQRAKSMIFDVKRGGMRKEVVKRRLDEIFGKGSRDENRMAKTMEKIAERIEEM